MKYLFLITLCWTVGFILPQLTAALQWAGAFVFVGGIVICVLYYIDTRINAVRL